MKKEKCRIYGKTVLSLFLCGIMAFGTAVPATADQAIRCIQPGEGKMEDWGNNINILLIGQDRREGVGGRRSDSMILCTFSPSREALVLTSVMRDLYVNIPGQGKNRINAAYAFGGPELLKKTVEENFHVPIDGCIEVDFDQFPKVIDLLGGVDLELRADEAAEINRLVPWKKIGEGMQHLSGDQALVYSRIRKLDADSDFSRTGRQRRLLGALMEAYRNIGLTDALKLLKEMLPMVDTDLTQWQVVAYCSQVLPVFKRLQVVSQRIPAPGDGVDQTINGMSVLVPNLSRVQAMLRDTLL